MSTLATDEVDVMIDPAIGDIPELGDIAMTSGITAVVQGARIRLQIVAGEWFLDRALGVAYFEREGIPTTRVLIGQKFDRPRALREFRAALSTVPGLVAITRLDVTFDGPTRTMAVTWQARCAFGDTPIDTLVIGA